MAIGDRHDGVIGSRRRVNVSNRSDSACGRAVAEVPRITQRIAFEIRRRWQRTLAVLSVLVGADGRVGGVNVATSSGFRILDDVATRAVKKWTFAPARRGSRAVESVVEVPMKFALSRE